ncbi:type II secretion system F family protein [Methylobacillus gramineus]|uniref:type II secretion system F family protein n=1 Tax=Methylobacillus gramineus TaxID=755169 RepID=UPI001CFF5B45|nr:type II secretion system F family protein [Methylobacillus gramineus]MCB5184476.1 type II secretion system F family protein [Methylobacillus gramineus]
MNTWLIFSFCLMLLVLAVLLWSASKQKLTHDKVRHNFEQALPHFGLRDQHLLGQGETWLERLELRISVMLGFELAPWHLAVLAGLILMVFILTSLHFLFWQSVVLTSLTGFTLLVVVPYMRLRRRRRVIVSQIPLFIDQVSRALSAGRSLEGAVRIVSEDIDMPLRSVLDRVTRATDLGVSFAEAVQRAADLHGIKELGLIALAVRISSNYGSSPQELLKSVVHMIRQREQAERELAAMTGETKVTAWVLSLVPLLIVAYMYIGNPGYIDMMLDDDTGALIFKVALAMQGIGILIFWRMMKSI